MKKIFTVSALLALIPLQALAQQLTVADYKRAEQQLSTATNKLVTATVDSPIWHDKTALIYRSKTVNGEQIFQIDVNVFLPLIF